MIHTFLSYWGNAIKIMNENADALIFASSVLNLLKCIKEFVKIPVVIFSVYLFNVFIFIHLTNY